MFFINYLFTPQVQTKLVGVQIQVNFQFLDLIYGQGLVQKIIQNVYEIMAFIILNLEYRRRELHLYKTLNKQQ